MSPTLFHVRGPALRVVHLTPSAHLSIQSRLLFLSHAPLGLARLPSGHEPGPQKG